MKGIFNTEPLSDEERHHLETVYGVRRRNFWLVLLMLTCFVGYIGIHALDTDADALHTSWYHISYIQFTVLFAGTFETVLLIFLIVYYLRRILPFAKDLKRGTAELIPFEIISKKEFPNTNQYFVTFADADYMHHEVDAAYYAQCKAGDLIFLRRAPHSKHIFKKDYRFEVC